MTDVSTTAVPTDVVHLDPTTGLPVAAAVAPAVAPAVAQTAVAPVVTSVPEAQAAPAAATTAPVETNAELVAAMAALTAEVKSLKAAQPAAPAVAVPANPPSPSNLFSKGAIVRYAWDDPYDGPSERYGLVIDTLPDQGAGAQSRLIWFTAGSSGPIGDHLLTAV